MCGMSVDLLAVTDVRRGKGRNAGRAPGTILLVFSLPAVSAPSGERYVPLPRGIFVSAPAAPGGGAMRMRLKPFQMRVEPETNAKYFAFVRVHPQWQRGRVLALFAGHGYLKAWQDRWRSGPVWFRRRQWSRR